MNFKLTKWKVIAVIIMLIITRIIHFYFYPLEDSNLLVMTAPGIFVYLIWSLFEKKRKR